MLFRQLFDRESCTYTYLLADTDSGEAVLIDPVRELVERDVQLLAELGLTLKYTLETHVHADHITASGLLRQRLGSQSVLSDRGGAPCVDIAAKDGDTVAFGPHTIECRATPGHTDGCMSYYVPDADAVFTGDTLFIRGCGRTDFQQGDAATLYSSVHSQLFSLDDATKVYPGHDYQGRTVSTIGEEKRFNPRLGGTSEAEFVDIMGKLHLAPPKKLKEAVPANQRCGLDLPEIKPSTVAWGPVVRSHEGIPEVDPAWVVARFGQVRLIDVREPAEFTGELGHVADAELVPLATLSAAAQSWDRGAPLVTICKSGGRSGVAAARLESMGFQRVASMHGGMMLWNDEGRPAVRTPAVPERV